MERVLATFGLANDYEERDGSEGDQQRCCDHR